MNKIPNASDPDGKGVSTLMGEQLYSRGVSPSGRVKYVPHSFEFNMRGWPAGDYFVHVREGGATIRSVDPACVEVDAAMLRAEQAMLDALLEASKAHPTSRSLTEKEQQAYKAYA